MEQAKADLKNEIETLLNRLGGAEVSIEPKVLEILSLESLEAIAEGLRQKAQCVNEEHKEWLLKLVDS